MIYIIELSAIEMEKNKQNNCNIFFSSIKLVFTCDSFFMMWSIFDQQCEICKTQKYLPRIVNNLR